MIKYVFYCAKASFLVLILLCFSIFASAKSNKNLSDSSDKPLFAAGSFSSANFYIAANNVTFPNALVGNEKESLEYIEKFSTQRRDYLLRMYKKGKGSFAKITKVFKRYNLPQELKVLIALESAFNGNAVSCAGAVGYWQIMDEVAKEYGLNYIPQPTAEEKKLALKNKNLKTPDSVKKVLLKDDRKNFNKSTLVAAKYLRDRSKNLHNNLLLIVASYNCGVGNVWKAMEKSGETNATFWDIKNYLPAETKAYVMNFITMNVIFNNYEKFAKNTLTFKPTKVLIDNFEKNVAEAINETGGPQKK